MPKAWRTFNNSTATSAKAIRRQVRLTLRASTDLSNKVGQLAMKLDDLNQNALRPFLAPTLGEKKLETVSINANFKANYNANGESGAKGNLVVTNLVVSDPSGRLPKTPLAVGMQLDAGMAKQVLDLRQFQVSLAPTDRATNQMQLAGKVDMSNTNAITGALKLSADSLDVTPYYDLFMSTNQTAAKPPEKTGQQSSGPTGSASEKEPEARHLPFQKFTFDTEIGRFYLREIAITNLVAKTALDGGNVTINPFQLTLNGAPVSSVLNVDLGVPGYRYDVNFQAANVPLAPLVDSLQPARKGQLGGTASSSVQIKGAGTTGASLQKSLEGQFNLGLTNLNLSVVQAKLPVLKTVIDVIVGLPDLIRNPGQNALSLLSQITGAGSQSQGGWIDEITKSPLEIVSVQGKAGQGKIDLTQTYAQTRAFLTDGKGTITLAPILTNSPIDIPVEVSLRRDLADKVGLVPSGTPTNANFVKLPDFLTVKGTLGKTEPSINYTALLEVIGKAGVGIIGNTGKAVIESGTNILGKLGGLLGGKSSGTNAPPKTESGTNILGTLEGLFGGKSSSTNAPSGTNAPPKKKGLFDIFK